MSRPPFIPYAPQLGDVIRPRDPRSPAMKVRCRRHVHTFVSQWTPRGHGRAVTWRLLGELAVPGARRLVTWNGAGPSCQVLGGLAARLRADAGDDVFAEVGTAEAPPSAIAAAHALFDEISDRWPWGKLPPGKLAWAFEVAVIEEAWDRFGIAAAAELASDALAEILPPSRRPPRPAGEAQL